MKHLTRKQRKALLRILVSAALFVPLFVIAETGIWDFFGSPYVELLFFLVPYLLVGYDVLYKAIRNLLHGRVFDEAFLMLVATVGALVLGFLPGAEAENAEAVGVMLFYQIGEFFQSIAVGKSRRSIAELMQIRPDYANLVSENGDVSEVDPASVPVGSVILVKPGERVPLDGEILDGASTLDTAALTGESVPREVHTGDPIVSGCVNLTGLLRVRTTADSHESTVSKILDLVERSGDAKAKSERFITRFARYYTPTVVFAAILLATVPPLFDGMNFLPWITRALIFLVVSCPCALVISVPLSFFGGIGGASRHGILVKGATYFEALSAVESVVFDKTGTLTHGRFSVAAVEPHESVTREELLSLAAHAEGYSSHPIALSLREAYTGELDPTRVGETEELLGLGLAVSVDGAPLYLGNKALMQRVGVAAALPDAESIGTTVYVAREGCYLGAITLRDEIKEDARHAIRSLKALGIRETVMLTGDRKETAAAVAEALSIDTVRAELLPADKVSAVEELLRKKSKNRTLAFVGDGINDAPVLARADVGIAMGALGSAAAIEAADIVLMDDQPSRLAKAIRIARKTLRIVRQNIVFAIGVKVLVMVLAALGLATMWLAVFADVGVAVIAILNAMRTMK